MSKYGGFFQGTIVMTPVAPLETTPRFAALRNYVDWMGKAGYRTTETSEIGWANADLFVAGLKAAGPDFTRQKVIDAINSFTDWNANGMITPVDWTKQHTDLLPALLRGVLEGRERQVRVAVGGGGQAVRVLERRPRHGAGLEAVLPPVSGERRRRATAAEVRIDSPS